MPRKVRWTPEDTVECYKRGWAPFTLDDGGVRILAVDEPDNVAEEHGFAPYTGHRFEGPNRDVNARRHVRRMAARGDRLCERALALAAANPSRL